MIPKSFRTFLICCFIGCNIGVSLTSCQDILEMDSDRQVFDPALDQKTDSIYYIIGMMQGLQQAIDQYVLTNELRGDLLAPTQFADSALVQLYNYTATTANRYDSAYVYYRVINNCNYYVTHRDTTLRTGSRQVALQEYAEALAIRAWSYLQLAKTYGSVPFYTHPLNNISQADEITEYRDIYGICDELSPELQKFSGMAVPDYGNINAFRTNTGQTKTVPSTSIMFPVDLVLADLYLEAGRYAEAARYYFAYIYQQRIVSRNHVCDWEYRFENDPDFDYNNDVPSDLLIASTETSYSPSNDYNGAAWTGSYVLNPSLAPTGDVITYIPMAVNKLQGVVSELQGLFGYNQFSFTQGADASHDEEFSLTWSDEYIRLTDSQLYYYLVTLGGNTPMADNLGDMRRWASTQLLRSQTVTDKRYNVITKYEGANVPIYRGSVIYLRLAECINRMGYPDAAFAILKDGLGNVAYTTAIGNDSYISPESYELLTTSLPFFTQANRAILGTSVGIHSHGSGYTNGVNSLYQYQTVIDQKAREMNVRYGFSLPETIEAYTETGKLQAMEIVEDLICDEYALEAAFEGHRFGDLCRLARHKNQSSVFGSDWGGRWLNAKLAFKHTGMDFSNERNWYLPFK